MCYCWVEWDSSYVILEDKDILSAPSSIYLLGGPWARVYTISENLFDIVCMFQTTRMMYGNGSNRNNEHMIMS